MGVRPGTISEDSQVATCIEPEDPIWIGRVLGIGELVRVARMGAPVRIAPEARDRVSHMRQALERAIAGGRVFYGINTGLGALCETLVPTDQLVELQHNLVRSHAAGVGPELDLATVRAVMLLRAHTLALGASGISLDVLELLVEMINRRVHPCIPCRGSVGASGDLAPLAHLALVLIGEGTAIVGEERLAGHLALANAGLRPLQLGPKEGLSLINGTQLISAIGGLALADSRELLESADIIGALSLDAHLASTVLLDERIHAGKPHPGQGITARIQRALIEGSSLHRSHRDCGRVQDAYSFRCMPQVHGAVRDAFDYVLRALQIEMNSMTDNPLLLPAEGGDFDVLSGGNFHGANLALPLDHLSAALTTLGSISERRIARQVTQDQSRGLPAFLATQPGLESGFMLAQVTAAALVSECKALSHPASVDSIPTSAGQEDHVSMGPIAGSKLRTIVDLTARVLAIEASVAARAIDLRPQPTSAPLQRVHARIRSYIPPFEKDRPMGAEFEVLAQAILRGELRDAAGLSVPTQPARATHVD